MHDNNKTILTLFYDRFTIVGDVKAKGSSCLPSKFRISEMLQISLMNLNCARHTHSRLLKDESDIKKKKLHKYIQIFIFVYRLHDFHN